MIKIMNVLPLVAALTITLLPGIASAEEITQPASSIEIASADPAMTEPTPTTQNEAKVAEVAQLPSKDETTTIQGNAEKKKKSTFAKVGSFLAEVLFFGDYPDGYTSFVSP